MTETTATRLAAAIVDARDRVHMAYGNHAAVQDGPCADGGPKYWRNCKHITAALTRLEKLCTAAGRWEEHMRVTGGVHCCAYGRCKPGAEIEALLRE